MRVLAIGNMYPPHHQGGLELMWQAVMRRARAAGHEVRVLVSDHREPEPHGSEEPDVHRVLRWYWSWSDYEFPQLGMRERIQLERANRKQLAAQLASFRPDVVTWWGMGGMSLSLIEQVRRRGIPALFSVHDDWLDYAWRMDQWIRIWRGARRLAAPAAELIARVPTRVRLERAGRLVFNSNHTLRRAREAGIDTTGARVVTPGIDARFTTALPPRPWGWRLLYIGRIDRNKGVDTAVAALGRLPAEATLTVLGTGDEGYVEELRRSAEEIGAGGRVEFAGFDGGAGVVRAYEEADAVLFPVRWEEPWGLVPLEAMGLGRPVVSTARGGTAEFIRDGDNALEIPPDDPAALADRVERLAADDGLRERLRAGGTRTANEHRLEDFERRMVEEIETAGLAAA